MLSLRICSLLCFLLSVSFGGNPVNGLPHSSKPHGQHLSSVVDLGYAKYQGTELEAGVTQWLGMRYAAPPLGNRRWRAPEDPQDEHGVQDATEFQATCLGLFGPGLSNTTNEDCLYLNVFAPSHATTDSNLPVWFFIQGGGYAGNTDENFNATEVIMKSGYNMVFVQINYRVGAFGFLASEEIRRNGDLNAGLLDQRKALEWAQKYIHMFGGNREHVVIHGDSAGAGSIAFQFTAYGGRDDKLFVGGIAESPFLPTHRTVSESEFQFNRFAKTLGCSDTHDPLACLRSLDTAKLQSADVVSPFPGGPNGVEPSWYFLPVVDGTFSPDYLYRLLEEGRVTRLPLIVGDDSDEGTGFSPNATSETAFLQFIKANYPHLTQRDLLEIKDAYPIGQLFPLHSTWFTPTEEAYGESTFICPGIEMVKSLASYNSPQQTWNYRYNVYDLTNEVEGLGVPHVSEKPAIFGPGNAGACGDPCSYTSYNRPIVPIVMNYWLSFIQTLDPNPLRDPSAPYWQPWGNQGNRRLRIQLQATEMEPILGDQLGRCDLWRRLATTLEQ